MARTSVTDGLRFTVSCDGRRVPTQGVLTALAGDASFQSWLNGLLADVPFAAFRWETPGVTAATAGRTFEFVALDAPYLARDPDPDAFRSRARPTAGRTDGTWAARGASPPP